MRLSNSCACSVESTGVKLKTVTEKRRSSACDTFITESVFLVLIIVQELCESRGGRPGLSVLTSLLVSVDVKIY